MLPRKEKAVCMSVFAHKYKIFLTILSDFVLQVYFKT